MTSKSQKNSDLRKRKAAAIETDTSSADVTLQHERDDASGKRKVAEQIQGDTRVEYQRDWFDDVTDSLCRYDTMTLRIIIGFTILAFVSRFWNIGAADFVVWDEAHFGKFAAYYLRRSFYFDVHPPMGKMLVAFGGALSGYNGTFEFTSGEKYPEELNYTGMRLFLASFGAMMVPMAFMTMIELGFTRRTAALAAVMVLCDNALLSISRYILLDSMLLYFTTQTVYCMTVFHRMDRTEPLTPGWWLWLCLTGLSIGFVSSVKWVGFFVTALVGLYTIEDLWFKLGDWSMPKMNFLWHFVARVIGLILIPAAVYVASFYLHFLVLSHSGPGDAQMSSLFQANLEGNKLFDSPVELAYGSKLTLKNNGYNGGLLHSHVQTYPAGSKQQQVTCYHHRDANNEWVIKKTREATTEDILNKKDDSEDPVQFVKHGDIVRLIHNETRRNLHSHPVAAPVTKNQHEVSCYTTEEQGDANDYWRVEIIDDLHKGKSDKIRSLSTRFRLWHVSLNCTLRSHNVNLPEWGFKQSEVVCDKRGAFDDHNIWNVEQQWNDKLPPGTKEQYTTSFWKDFAHVNVAMYSTNNALVPDPDKEPDQLTSKPMEWPFCTVGLRMCGWGDNDHKVYLLGNPVVWWSGAAALLGFGAIWAFYQVRMQRGFYDLSEVDWNMFLFCGKLFGIGWVLHFLPFMVMARVTYLHHYFPALYFAILMGAFMFEHVVERTVSFPDTLKWVFYYVALAAIIGVHAYFAPISYGFSVPASAYADRKWLDTWTMV